MAKKKSASAPTRAELAAVREHFAWMLAPLRGLRRNPASLLNQPTTYMNRVRSKVAETIERRIAEVGQDQFMRELAGVGIPRRVLVEGFACVGDHLREEERAIAALPGGRGLLGLFGAADARVHNSPLMLFMNLKLVLGMNMIAPAGDLYRALRERGERRARLLLRAIADIAEELYRPYLIEVWNLTEFADASPRAPRRPPPGFGRLVEELGKRLEGVEGVVDPLALRIRNAVDHNHFEYKAKMKAVVLWNKDGWREEIAVDSLQALTERLLAVAGTTFPRVLQWFLQTAFLHSGLFSAVVKVPSAMQRNDEAELRRVGLEIEARTQAMYMDIARLYATGQGGGEHLREVAEQSRQWFSGSDETRAAAARTEAAPSVIPAPPLALPPHRPKRRSR